MSASSQQVNSEFAAAASPTSPKSAGLRLYARRVAEVIENTPVNQPEYVTPSGTYPRPGRGEDGESSN